MEHAPHIHVVGLFNVEDEIGEPLDRPEKQTGEPELRRVAWRTAGRMRSDVAQCGFDCFGPLGRQRTAALASVVPDCFVDVALG